MKFGKKFSWIATLVVVLALAVPWAVFADNLKNDAVAAGNNTITAGGTTTIKYWIQEQQGCAATALDPVIISIIAPAGVTATPSTLTFTLCNTTNEGNPTNTQNVVFGSSTAGSYSISATADDTDVNTSPASFTLYVNAGADTTPPVLTVPNDITAEATSAAGAVVNFTATATDAVDPNPVVTCAPPSGSTFALGTTVVSCTAKDATGNTSVAQTFNVKVQDTTVPVLTVPADITAEATSAAGAVVNFTATATDTVDPNPVVTCAPPSGSTFALGTTVVSCTAKDATGNTSAAQTFNVKVQDTIAPVLTVPTDITAGATSAAGAVVNFTATATDTVDPDPVVTCAPLSGSLFAPGSTTVSCTAKDASGNVSAAKTFKVTVKFEVRGFYQPVDMGNVYNIVKGGSTVPLKFEVFAGSTELTDISVVKSFVQTKIACDGSTPTDEVTVTTTGGTSLRYDALASQFIQNWQTPKQAGQCYRVTLTTQDDSTIVALFKLK